MVPRTPPLVESLRNPPHFQPRNSLKFVLDKQLRPGMARARNRKIQLKQQTNMKTRNGKIARLPLEIREQLNCRLADGEPGNRLGEWLNSNPDVMKVMAEQFEGRPITEQNISEWRAGGYEEWLTLHAFLDETRVISENAEEIADTGISSDHLHIVLLAHHARLLRNLETMPENEFKTRLNTVRKLTASIMNLRRDELQKARLELQRERLEFLREKESSKSASSAKVISSTSTNARPTPAETTQPATTASASPARDNRSTAESPDDKTSAPSLSAPSLEARPTVSPGLGRIHPDVSHLATHSPCHPLSRLQTPASRDWSDSVGTTPNHPPKLAA
jgi:hypothetical protein